MKPIASLASHTFKWTQPRAFRMEYELRAGDELAGTLRFRNQWSSFATGKCADGCWTFQRSGVFKQRVIVRACRDATVDVAIFHENPWKNGGTLEIAGGSTFVTSGNLWQNRHQVSTRSGEPLIELKPRGFLHYGAGVEIKPQVTRLPELPLLLNLGWYLTVLMHQDGAVAAAL